MKNSNTRKPTRSKFTLLRQLCNLIPNHLVPQLARETGVEDHARTFSPWSHTVSLLYAQLTHALGLNDVCDALQLHTGPLSAIRGATPPRKNTLSHATALVELAWRLVVWQRDSALVKKWWGVFGNPKATKAARKKAIVALARQMAVDLWRWRTGRVQPATLGWTMVAGAA